MEKLYLSKFECDQIITNLIKQIIRSNEQFTHIVGIANGGLNVSFPISSRLNIPHKSITLKFYDDETTPSETPKKLDFSELNDLDSNCNLLFCDDLIDTGISLLYLKNNIKFKHKTAVMYWNKNNKYNITPDYFYYEKPKQWLVFHWETKKDTI